MGRVGVLEAAGIELAASWDQGLRKQTELNEKNMLLEAALFVFLLFFDQADDDLDSASRE